MDATVGAGGHAEALLERGPGTRLLGLDRDPEALGLARERLRRFGPRVELRHENFADLDRVLEGFAPPDGILADLGVSSMQLEDASRGFSFRREGPLDMRMGQDGRSAAAIVATASAEELTRILREYGEERMAAKIARGIVAERSRGPLTTTRQLARVVARIKGVRESIDPATRVFQALRIEVNQELFALSRFLAAAANRLNARGRLAVISYHSLEDRIVKDALREGAKQGWYRLLTKKPVMAGEDEIDRNPRSRSAKMRAAEKV